ncbi:acyl carrier protein-like protein [Tanacetum coccineum]
MVVLSGIHISEGSCIDPSYNKPDQPLQLHGTGVNTVVRDIEVEKHGHIYEEDVRKVKFGKITIGEDGFIRSRNVVMPGVKVENGGSLSALSLAFKGERIKSK